MPSPQHCLTPDDVHAFVRERCLPPASAGTVGVELEWLTVAEDDPTAPVDFAAVHAALDGLALPGGSRITWEPGGQVELSGAPLPGVAPALAAIADDLDTVRAALTPLGVRLAGVGRDPARAGRRVLELPRYQAMQAYFDGIGPDGRVMMLSTASIQVNLDTGPAGDVGRRWRLAHDLGPVLAAACANSPFASGAPAGVRSTRLATWTGVDPTRAWPPNLAADPAEAWADYVLQAHVMLVRATDHDYRPLTTPLSFARWMAEGHELGFPTLDDLAYHLTTLFPPVRARGWLELRTVDALPAAWWPVPVAIATALLDDEEASAAASRALAGCADLWPDARHGLTDSRLAAAARAAFALALDALPRLGAAAATVDVVARFADRYVERARCPADDLLDAWARDGSLLPADPPVELSWT